MKRRLFIASSLAAAGLAGCGSAGNALNDSPLHQITTWAEAWNHALIGSRGLAREYPDSAVDRNFRMNGLDTPSDGRYAPLVAQGFRGYRLPVGGLVQRPQVLTLAELRALPQRTQTTRHDCVEGWSAIGKWRGVRLADVLAMAQPRDGARYVVFRCFDRDQSGSEYYESLDLAQAAHPQALLALDLNDAPLDPDHGAPVRLRVPTQLGYKSAKWVRGIELAAALPGRGGYWEDQGYEWYAGI